MAQNRCLCLHCQAYLLEHLSVHQAPSSAQAVPPHPQPWPHRNLLTQTTWLFIATRCPLRCLHSRLWQQCNSSRFGLWSRFPHQYWPPRTTAPRTLLPHLWFSNTPPCSPQGHPSHYFSRYHRATFSQPGYKVCAPPSPSILPSLKPLPCLGLRAELFRWTLPHRHPPPSSWGVVRH